MGKKPPKWLPGERVNETILTQRKSVEQLRADRVLRKKVLSVQKERMKVKLDAKRKRRLSTKKFVPASAILKQTLRRERQVTGFYKRGEVFSSRLSRKPMDKISQQYANAPVALIVRTAGKQIPRQALSAFRRLGLDKLYKARLVHLNPANDKLSKELKTFTTIGFPTATELEELIRTRASFWNPETKSKCYLSGNLQVEQALGEYGVLSIEELVDAIVGKSEHIDAILKRLAPFDFHPPRKLHVENRRSAHAKLELANPKTFGKLLATQLAVSARGRAHEKKTKLKAARKAPVAESKATVESAPATGPVATSATAAARQKKVVAVKKAAPALRGRKRVSGRVIVPDTKARKR